MEAREELNKRRKQLQDEFGGAQLWIFIYSILVFVIVGVVGITWFAQWLPQGAEPPDWWVLVILLCATVFAGVVTGLMAAGWWSHYHYVWRHLKHANLAAVVLDESYWDVVMARAEGSLALKLSGFARPVTLPEQLELSGDYWGAALCMARSCDEAQVARAASVGNATRLCNNVITWLTNSGCSFAILIFMATLVIPLFPLIYPALYFFIKQQATVAALIDFFIDRPRLNRAKLKPLA